jgi:Cu/Ag efflux pump CusA
VATIREGSGPATIDRLDRERNVTVTAELNGLPLDSVMKQVRGLEAMAMLPPGVRVLPTGDSEAFVELFTGFAFAMLFGIVSVYLVLLLLFHSASQPLTILSAVPLCGGGAFRHAADLGLCAVGAVADRSAAAHRDRDEELDPDRRLRDHRRAGSRPVAGRCDHRRVPQARAAR